MGHLRNYANPVLAALRVAGRKSNLNAKKSVVFQRAAVAAVELHRTLTICCNEQDPVVHQQDPVLPVQSLLNKPLPSGAKVFMCQQVEETFRTLPSQCESNLSPHAEVFLPIEVSTQIDAMALKSPSAVLPAVLIGTSLEGGSISSWNPRRTIQIFPALEPVNCNAMPVNQIVVPDTPLMTLNDSDVQLNFYRRGKLEQFDADFDELVTLQSFQNEEINHQTRPDAAPTQAPKRRIVRAIRTQSELDGHEDGGASPVASPVVKTVWCQRPSVGTWIIVKPRLRLYASSDLAKEKFIDYLLANRNWEFKKYFFRTIKPCYGTVVYGMDVEMWLSKSRFIAKYVTPTHIGKIPLMEVEKRQLTAFQKVMQVSGTMERRALCCKLGLARWRKFDAWWQQQGDE